MLQQQQKEQRRLQHDDVGAFLLRTLEPQQHLAAASGGSRRRSGEAEEESGEASGNRSRADALEEGLARETLAAAAAAQDLDDGDEDSENELDNDDASCPSELSSSVSLLRQLEAAKKAQRKAELEARAAQEVDRDAPGASWRPPRPP